MQAMIPYVLFAVGLILIVKGGDWFVDAAAYLARATGIPQFVIGATVVSVATTFPELLVSALAAQKGQVDFAVGNSVGSVSVNIGLILALLLIFIPTNVERREFSVKGALMLCASAVLWLFSLPGRFTIPGVVISCAVFILFLWENLHIARRSTAPITMAPVKKERKEMILQITKFIVGAAAIAVGARLLIDQGTLLAKNWGIPDSVISVTLVALGTSLPELVTAVSAIIKKQPGLSVGNILGAGVIDLCLILPVCTALSGRELPLSAQALRLDLPFCFILCAVTVIPAVKSGKLYRLQGIGLMAIYAVYAWLVFSGVAA